jgi:hypothetical protein
MELFNSTDINYTNNNVSDHLNHLNQVMSNSSENISTSDSLTGLELRLSNLFVKHNHTNFIHFPGLANLYVITLVIDSTNPEPSKLDIRSFPKVGDNEALNVDRTLYYWKQTRKEDAPPSQIHALVSVIKSKERLREFGNTVQKITENDENKNIIIDAVEKVISGGSVAIVDGLAKVANIIGNHLGAVEDKPLFTWVQSFTDIGGDFDKLGKIIVKPNYPNKYIDCELSFFVRDVARDND